MGDLDGWHNALQHLKSVYKDESTVSNIATANFVEDAPEEEYPELKDIDEHLSYHSCIPMSSDKYEIEPFNHDLGFGEMDGIIDVSSIYGDDDSDIKKLHVEQQENLQLDMSEIKGRPTNDLMFDKAEDLIHATEDLSAGSGSDTDTDGSSIILNVWNEDFEGRPDPEVMKKLIEAKKLPRGLDPVVVTQIKRARIINKLRVMDDDSSQGSCAVMMDHMCMPRFCAEGELTDEESIGNSLVDSIKEGSITASLDLEFFQHKRPKRSQYALVPDAKFDPDRSPEDLVLVLPKKNSWENESLPAVASFLPSQQLTYDGDDSEKEGTYVEEEQEFTLQKYDRAPHRIAELVLAGKKSEAPHYTANQTNSTAETTPSRISFTKETKVCLDSCILKNLRVPEDGDPIDGDRSIASTIPEEQDEPVEEMVEPVEESPLTEFVALFSDPNYAPPVIEQVPVTEEKASDNEEAIKNEVPEVQISSTEPQDVVPESPLEQDIHDEIPPSQPFSLPIMTCGGEANDRSDDVEPLAQVEPEDVSTSPIGDYVNDLQIGPNEVTSSLTGEFSLNTVGSSYDERNIDVDTIEQSNKIESEDSASISQKQELDRENCPPSLDIANEIQSEDQKEAKEQSEENPEDPVEVKEQVYVENRKTISMASVQSAVQSAQTDQPVQTEKKKLLNLSSCCNPLPPLPTTTMKTAITLPSTAKSEDGVQDLMKVLDLTLEGTNTDSYSTLGGEEVVMAMPMQGIVVEQPQSNFGRIISPEEFEKLQESLYRSMNLDESEVLNISSLKIDVSQNVENVMDDGTTEPEAKQNGKEEEENSSPVSLKAQMTAVSHASTDFYDARSSPTGQSPNNDIIQDSQQDTSFGVVDEMKVDDVILDIIDDLKVKVTSPSKNIEKNETTAAKIDATSSTTRESGRKDRRKKRSKKRSSKSKSKKEEPSIVDELHALRRTISKNSTRSSSKSKINARSGASSLGLKSSSLLDGVTMTDEVVSGKVIDALK